MVLLCPGTGKHRGANRADAGPDLQGVTMDGERERGGPPREATPAGAPGPGEAAGGVLLLGAGHGHLDVLRAADRFARLGCALRLVAPGPFHYSGSASAVLAGELPAAAHRLDVERALEPGAFVRGRVRAIEPRRRRVVLEDGTELGYGLLSVNLGSRCPGTYEQGRFGAGAFRAKPVEELVELGVELDRLGRERRGTPPHLVVVGAGASGCELALCAERRLGRSGGGRVTVVTGGADRTRLLGADFAPAARARMDRALGRRGVALVHARAVRATFATGPLRGASAGPGGPGRARAGTLELSDGEALAFDALLDASGTRPPELIAASGLSCVDGALEVDAQLRSVDDPRVFAVGDCAAFEGRALPRIGVHAVRQGQVLRDNLLALLRGEEPGPYRPQRRALAILNLGDGTALAARGRLVAEGRLPWRLKRFIDGRFLARHAASFG